MNEKPGDMDQWLKDLPVTADKPGFKPEEMAACPKCQRKNPPTRANCFYCGEQIKSPNSIGEGEALPEIRQMEAWEKGFNIIVLNSPLNAGANSYTEENIAAAARLLNWDPRDLKIFLQKECSLPLLKTSSTAEAGSIAGKLGDAGLRTLIWPDEEIEVQIPTRRLRGMEFEDKEINFHLFNVNEIQKVPYEDLALVITGSLFEKKVASTEKRKKNEEKQVTESTETSHDEPVVDIYSLQDGTGWRVLTKGFDFSCLGANKGLLAVENIKRLVEAIAERAPQARVDESYNKMRPVLGRVWENEQKLASHNWQRESMGKFHFDNVTVIDNNAQFTKYSRLQWRLLKNK